MFWQSRGFRVYIVALAGVGWLACEKAPPKPASVGMPPLAESPNPHTEAANPHAALPPSHPPVHGLTPTSDAKTGQLTGILHVGSSLKGKIPAHGVIFLMARQADGAGPPVAAQKLPLGVWPLRFQIGPDDVMLEGATLTGTVVLSARIDQDGDAMTKQPGDLVATSRPITVPSQQLVLTFDKLL